MKVYPLHIGDSKIPYGQFYGGASGEWEGLGGIWRFISDKNHYIIVPIYAYLIDHPTAGLILVDTGINWDMAHHHNQFYKHWLFHLTLDEDEYRLTHEQELAAHLQRLGYRAEDIKTVLITHLHEDHLGELRSLRHAKIIVSQDAWDAKNLGIWLFREWSPCITGIVDKPELINYTSGRFHSFDKSQDVVGDGSIVLLPTPGHADGHFSVFVQMEGYQLLLVADAMYALRHLAVDDVRAILLGSRMKAEYIDSIKRIQQLRGAFPDMIIVPTHDHTAYQFQYIEPFLADGALSPEERQAIKTYEAQMFSPGWRLKPNYLPRYIPGTTQDHVGLVTEP